MTDILLEPWPLRGTAPDEPTPPITKAIDDAVDRLIAERVVKTIVRENKMSLMGKLAHLTQDAQDFTKETVDVLDGIAAKIATARAKRDTAKDKQHGYYDAIIKGVDDNIAVIERLSNGPLSDE